jgi:hypothetical protein
MNSAQGKESVQGEVDAWPEARDEMTRDRAVGSQGGGWARARAVGCRQCREARLETDANCDLMSQTRVWGLMYSDASCTLVV